MLDVESKKLEYFTVDRKERKGDVDLTGVVASMSSTSRKSVVSKFGAQSRSFVVVYPARQEHKRTRMFLVAESLEECISWVSLINSVSRSGVNDDVTNIDYNEEDFVESDEQLMDTDAFKSSENSNPNDGQIKNFISTFVIDNAVLLLLPLSILFLKTWIQPYAFLFYIYMLIFMRQYNVGLVLRPLP